MSNSLISPSQDGVSTILNLTPHDVVIISGGVSEVIRKSGIVARVTTKSEKIGTVRGISLFTTLFGEVESLPAPVSGTFHLVSALVRAALPDRKDLLSPSQLVRGSDGQVIGCAGFDANI